MAAGASSWTRQRQRTRSWEGRIPDPTTQLCLLQVQPDRPLHRGTAPPMATQSLTESASENPVGIPLSRLGVTAEGGLHLPGGQVGSLIPNEDVFQREMFGSAASAGKPAPAPGAAPQQQVAAPASGPLMLDSKPHTEEPSSSAMVLFTAPDAGPPALAGEDQLFQALAQPVAKPQPKPDAAPALPLPMPFLPGQAPPFPLPTFAPALGQPMSKEEFERLRKDASRKKRRSASRGSSRCATPFTRIVLCNHWKVTGLDLLLTLILLLSDTCAWLSCGVLVAAHCRSSSCLKDLLLTKCFHSIRSRSRSPGRRSRRRRSRTRSSSDRSSRSPERRRRGKDTHRHRAGSSRLGR